MTWQEFLTFAAICLIVFEVFLLLFVMHMWLFRTAEFFAHAFPKEKPPWSLVWSREPGVGDMLIVYYCVRLLFWCAVPLLALITLRAYRII
jgi:hypothetical protein